jgi:hypothetical protein
MDAFTLSYICQQAKSKKEDKAFGGNCGKEKARSYSNNYVAAPITILMRREVRLTWRERIPAAILFPRLEL